MTNKTVHRTEKLKSGTYTTVPYHILRDNNLTANARLLMIEILSDSDEFKLSQTTYCNRLNWDGKQFTKAIECLEKHGYAKRTPIDKDKCIPGIKKAGSNKTVYHYTISEFGNLNKDEVETSDIVTPSKDEIARLEEFLLNNEFAQSALAQIDEGILKEFAANKETFDKLETQLVSITKKLQTTYLKEAKDNLKGYHSGKYSQSMIKKMDDYLKQIIFNDKRYVKASEYAGANNEAQMHWNSLVRKHEKSTYNQRVDMETRMFDARYED